MESVKISILNKKSFWLLGALILFALIKILVAVHFDLNSEEAQYWTWSKHLQLSYYSKTTNDCLPELVFNIGFW